MWHWRWLVAGLPTWMLQGVQECVCYIPQHVIQVLGHHPCKVKHHHGWLQGSRIAWSQKPLSSQRGNTMVTALSQEADQGVQACFQHEERVPIRVKEGWQGNSTDLNISLLYLKSLVSAVLPSSKWWLERKCHPAGRPGIAVCRDLCTPSRL